MSAVTFEIVGRIAVLTIDHPPVNALSYPVRIGLREGLAWARQEEGVDAVVLTCAGKGFSAGADITEFGQPGGPKEPRMRQIIPEIEDFPKPIVAAIHGTALGGGLETAMACHYRVATPDATFGLPEVNIGLIPGGGGTQRLPRLIGPEAALDIMTSGRHVDADYALRHGLIDAVAEGALGADAVAFAERIVAEGKPPRVTSRHDDKLRGLEAGFFAAFRGKIAKRARGQIAPFKIVEAVEIASNGTFDEGSRFEFEAFNECMASPQRAALIHLFKAERAARRIPGLEGVEPLPIRKAAVIGSGTMGGGIAMSLANAGIDVALIDISDAALERGMEVTRRNYATSVSRGSTSAESAEAALARLRPTTDYSALADVDIAVECVLEDMALKQKVFAEIDRHAPAHAVLATNTSSLDIDAIAAATSRPERVVGTHFFSPANVMKLLENVRGARTSPQTIATVMALARRIGKVAVLAGNCDAFIGNRMFQFYNNAWEYLLEEGASPEQIDRAALDFGMAMGPVAVRDMAGLDVACLVRKARAPRLPKEERLSPILEKLVEAGRLGQKTGAGLYRYEGRTPVADPVVTGIIEAVAAEAGIDRRPIPDEAIMPRLLAPLVNEGAKILEEGIALRAGDIDVAYCHGYGFPKHLGGPMFWAERHGLDRILATMRELEPRFGPRYAPAALLVERAGSGRGW